MIYQISISCFQEDMDRIQDFQDCIKRIGGIVRRPSFRFSKVWICIFIFIKLIYFENDLNFLGLFEVSLGSPKTNNIGFGARGHVQKSRNHRNEGFKVPPQANRTVIRPRWTRINLRSFWSCIFHKFTIKWPENGRNMP